MLGKRPYLGRSRKEIRDQILAKQVQIKKEDIPRNWSIEAADFINRLIQRKPSKRLGITGPKELKNHPWFKNYPWEKLLKKEIKPPFKPDTRNVFEYAKHISEDDTDPDLQAKSQQYLRRNSVQDLFQSYYFENKPKRPLSSKSSSIKKKLSSSGKFSSFNSSIFTKYASQSGRQPNKNTINK